MNNFSYSQKKDASHVNESALKSNMRVSNSNDSSLIQMMQASTAGSEDSKTIQTMQNSSDEQSMGNKMPNAVQTKMENAFGEDFSSVNIHSNSQKSSSLGALAYTQGNDVHFAPGQYNLSSSKGQELLGHELTHVVQQKKGSVEPTKQAKGHAINDSPSLEKEADVMGAKAAKGQQVRTLQTAKKGALQMKPKKTVSALANNRLNLAKNAITHTKNIMAFGAGNQKEALKNTNLNSHYRKEVVRNDKYWIIADDVKPIAAADPLALIAAKAEIAQGGNCGEHAVVAFNYLDYIATGETLNLCGHEMDHAFVILGKLATEKDDELVVADPWPTNATATLWEDHFAHNDGSKMQTHSSIVADGKNAKEVIKAGLKLTFWGLVNLMRFASDEDTKDHIEGNPYVWDHADAAGSSRDYEYELP